MFFWKKDKEVVEYLEHEVENLKDEIQKLNVQLHKLKAQAFHLNPYGTKKDGNPRSKPGRK